MYIYIHMYTGSGKPTGPKGSTVMWRNSFMRDMTDSHESRLDHVYDMTHSWSIHDACIFDMSLQHAATGCKMLQHAATHYIHDACICDMTYILVRRGWLWRGITHAYVQWHIHTRHDSFMRMTRRIQDACMYDMVYLLAPRGREILGCW